MKNYKNRLYTAQLQKAYSQISDAAQAIMNDEHVDNFYETQAIIKLLLPAMNVPHPVMYHVIS